MFFGVFLISILFLPIISSAYAEIKINIFTEKEIYSYGDFLTFTIEVSEVTGEIAILHIIDEAGISSSPIPIEITDLKTILPSPFPFESTTYPLGKYYLEIQYSESFDSTEFELIDSGKVVIPLWIKEFGKYWYNGAISDVEYANGIEFLIKEEIIVVPQSKTIGNTPEVKIPQWVKATTGWWIDGIVSDSEYAASLEYLIKEGIIKV